jgi:hypothetical protein
MFGFKKVVILAASLAALAIPSLASADDYDHRELRNDREIAQLRVEIRRDRLELDRDLRMHRWEAARRERRELDRHEARLNALLRHDGRR